jgi:hypothetical protein
MKATRKLIRRSFCNVRTVIVHKRVWHLAFASRVNRLGEFSPTYWAIDYFWQLYKKYGSRQKVWATFFQGKIYVLIWSKNGLGYILGNIKTQPSHPVRRQH